MERGHRDDEPPRNPARVITSNASPAQPERHSRRHVPGNITRRSFLAGAAGLAATFALAACGGDDDDDSESGDADNTAPTATTSGATAPTATTAVEPTEESAPTTAAEPTATTAETVAATPTEDDSAAASPSAAGEFRTIVHKFGETQVPLNPQRVACVGWDEHDFLLSFGIRPIIQQAGWGEQPFGTWPWALDALGDAEPELIEGEDLFPYERLLTLKPDLIQAAWAGLTQEQYDNLSQIAPTVAQHPDYEDWDTPWDVRVLRMGEVYGMEAEAQAMVDGVQARIEQVRTDHPAWQEMQGVSVTVGEGQFYAAGTEHGRGRLIMEFGFQLPQEIEEHNQANLDDTAYSGEMLAVIDRDVIIWVNGQDDSSNIVNLPLRTGLKAHAEGREVYCDKALTAAFSIESPLSFGYVFDTLIPEIERAVDGDPATPVEAAVEYGIAPTT